MIEPEQGFGIDTLACRWGTLPGDISGMGRLPSAAGYLHRDLPCRSIFGFSAAGATVSAPAADRPVMSISYELAAPWWFRARPDQWLDPLLARFGAPTSDGHRDVGAYRVPSSAVARWARWQRATIDISLSIYGGIRSAKFGRSAGLIALAWTDTIAAASPFVPGWRAACEALELAARSVQGFRRFDVRESLQPAAGSETDSIELLAAHRALHKRTILATPQPIRERLDHGAFALWQSAIDGQWAFSSVWDTVLLRAVRVAWNEIRPAKGGGRSQLGLGGWWVSMPYGTPAIGAAAAALKSLPGVVVELYEGYDT